MLLIFLLTLYHTLTLSNCGYIVNQIVPLSTSKKINDCPTTGKHYRQQYHQHTMIVAFKNCPEPTDHHPLPHAYFQGKCTATSSANVIVVRYDYFIIFIIKKKKTLMVTLRLTNVTTFFYVTSYSKAPYLPHSSANLVYLASINLHSIL